MTKLKALLAWLQPQQYWLPDERYQGNGVFVGAYGVVGIGESK